MIKNSKLRPHACLLALFGLASLAACSLAAEPPASTNSVSSELMGIISHVQAKGQTGPVTEADLAPEFKQLDCLLAQHKGETNDEVAQVLLTKARIYREVLRDTKMHDQLAKQLKHDFPNSRPAGALRRVELTEKAHAQLVAGAPFPDFSQKDTAGTLRSASAYKGKVLLIDFWATWCGPCVKELPNVLDVYEKHHAQGFEVLGVSLDSDAEKLQEFIRQRNIPWPQILDQKDSDDALAVRYGVNGIPATFLLDKQGKIIAVGVRGEALERAVTDALAAK
jgi:peroxiredoxin